MVDVPATQMNPYTVADMMERIGLSPDPTEAAAAVVAASPTLVHQPGLVSVHQKPSGFATAYVNWDVARSALLQLNRGESDWWLLALACNLANGETIAGFSFADITRLNQGETMKVLTVMCSLGGFRFQ